MVAGEEEVALGLRSGLAKVRLPAHHGTCPRLTQFGGVMGRPEMMCPCTNVLGPLLP